MRPSSAVLPPPQRVLTAATTAAAAAASSPLSLPHSSPCCSPWQRCSRPAPAASHYYSMLPMSPARRSAAFQHAAAEHLPRKRSLFTSSILRRPDDQGKGDGRDQDASKGKKGSSAAAAAATEDPAGTPAAVLAKRKARAAGAKHSLRRVAVIAQQQPGGRPGAAAAEAPEVSELALPEEAEAAKTAAATATAATAAAARPTTTTTTATTATGLNDDGSNVISAVCLAESFDMEQVMALLQDEGYVLDPDGSGFESHEVVHARRRWPRGATAETAGSRDVDLYVFESGTLVGWGLPADAVDSLATRRLVTAAADPFVAERESETLEFRCDGAREARASAMRGDVVVLGTRTGGEAATPPSRLATTLAQIAFSSGLARSTKLAVLEASFMTYFESTRRIPEMLARGRSLGLSQRFILQKTGELLSLRAQLNHYRELTDALPDIFWDARAELGLEGYYEQVGRALDVGVRIKTLNQKMDYAQEIATVLREVSSERHGTRLEWIIIVLITVEVVFELRRVYLEWPESEKKPQTA